MSTPLPTFHNLRLSLSSTILILHLSNPPTNAFTTSLYTSLISALDYATSRNNLTCLLITGSGNYFTSGVDFIDQSENYNESIVKQFMLKFMNFPIPIIACLNGPAIGIGATLLYHCDYIFGSSTRNNGKRNYVLMPFTKWCLAPEFCSSVLLGRRMGVGTEMLLFGERVSIKKLADLGFLRTEPEYTPKTILNHTKEYIINNLSSHVHSRESAMLFVKLTRLKRNKDLRLEEVMNNEMKEIEKRVDRGEVREAVLKGFSKL
ncbi:hypothetical protein TL16_g03988 [Triparma laevis f. inornata]|uniref:Uncharacterized protein n=1 Tax=Triparma laevis f. inornata TaxID=1714386 RepID=A0A9W7A5N5_9STRA|nr:hypothetical protein TL16_g03988 [Triparma laevis f. inornata]